MEIALPLDAAEQLPGICLPLVPREQPQAASTTLRLVLRPVAAIASASSASSISMLVRIVTPVDV